MGKESNTQADIDFITAISPNTENAPSETVDTTTEQIEVVEPVAQVQNEVAQMEIDTPFFNLNSKVDDTDFNDLNNLYGHINKKYGAEIKEPKELLGILSRIDELSEKEQDYLGQINSLKQLEVAISSMPDEIKALMNDYANGKDYKKTLSSIAKGTAIDFTKEASSYDADKLIQFYNDDISKEELEDMDEKLKSRLYSISLKQYNQDRELSMNRLKQQELELSKRKETFNQSVEDSLAELKRRFPEFKKRDIDAIRERMINGYSLYDATTSSYAKDAAVKIAMAEFGETALVQLKQSAEQLYKAQLNKEVSKEREFYAQHQNDRPTATPSEQGSNIVNKIVEQETAFLSKKSNYI